MKTHAKRVDRAQSRLAIAYWRMPWEKKELDPLELEPGWLNPLKALFMKGETHVLRICTLVHQSMQRPYMRRCFRVRESRSVFHFRTFASTHRIPTRRPSAPTYRRTHTERSRTDQPAHPSVHRCERICYRCRLTVCFVQYGPITKVTRATTNRLLRRPGEQ